MASDRQIGANRRNAQKSTGPKTEAGKKRAGANAYRHGLTSRRIAREALAQEIDQLARKIAGDSENLIILEWTRTAAEALLNLRRVRNTRAALLEPMAVLGTPQQQLDAAKKHRLPKALQLRGIPTSVPRHHSPSTDMPSVESEQTAESVRHLLPELIILERYERRAWSRRDKALREIRKYNKK